MVYLYIRHISLHVQHSLSSKKFQKIQKLHTENVTLRKYRGIYIILDVQRILTSKKAFQVMT